MRTVKLSTVVDDVLAQAGMVLAAVASPDAMKAQVVSFVNRRLREAWEHDTWAELCPTERRWYRPIWDAATTYAEGAEVYYGSDAVADTVAELALDDGVWFLVWADTEGAAGYFSPNSDDMPAAGESPATHPDKWVRLVSMRRYVALDQPGKTEIGEVYRVTFRDPRLRPSNAGRIGFTLSTEGIVPEECAGHSVWVSFRIRPYVFTAADYANNAKVLPYVLSSFVIGAAYADLLRGDDRHEEAGRARADAYNQLYAAADIAGATQEQFTTATAQTY
ncbi:MAG: hypothetical protein H7Y06_13020 [Opitutaceae bacterium]|nr:hypothetical protein [Opitutaceae bacterium]